MRYIIADKKDLSMSKKFYVRGSNYGGEMTIGEVTKEFVEYWKPICDEEGDGRLIDHLMALESFNDNPEEEEGFDPDSPAVLENMDYYNSWYDIDEIHHHTSSSGLELMAFELDADGCEDWDKRIEFDPHQLYSRECYTQAELQDDDPEDNSVPVLVFYSSEKGDFGGWFIDLEDDQDFDPKLVVVSSVETDHGEMIERLWYNGVEYEQDYDNVDSRGKGYYAGVAYFNKRWEDPHVNPETDQDLWDELWEYYNEEILEST